MGLIVENTPPWCPPHNLNTEQIPFSSILERTIHLKCIVLSVGNLWVRTDATYIILTNYQSPRKEHMDAAM